MTESEAKLSEVNTRLLYSFSIPQIDNIGWSHQNVINLISSHPDNCPEGLNMPGKTMIYVGAEADGLYRKEESDGKWEKLAKGMPPSPQVRAIAIHPNDSKTIFVGTQRGVYRSQNGGDSFERMNMAEGLSLIHI